jgi:predicted MPP superfamily phosphohydrolase
VKRPLAALATLGLAAAAWGQFEAGWVRLRTLEVPLPRLPAELSGLRIVHLSDFHLGFPSRGEHAVHRAVHWAAAREPDLTAITGDLLSQPSAEPSLRVLLDLVPGSFAVLGNHDFASSRDPFSRPSAVTELGATTVLADEARTVELRGRRVQVVGVDPRSYQKGTARPEQLADPDADLRILLCHFPNVIDKLPAGVFDLVLAGHLHGGQICIPYGRGKLRLAHLRWTYAEGLYRRPGGVLHVSPGLGTTFVPFRFFARPEATELVLRSRATGPGLAQSAFALSAT